MVFVRRYVPPVILLALLVLVWQVSVVAFDVAPYLLPSPAKVWTAFGEVRATLPGHIETTLLEAVLGLLLGAVIGVAVAAVLWASGLARRAVFPLLVITQTVPMVVLAPLLVLWFGLGLTPKV